MRNHLGPVWLALSAPALATTIDTPLLAMVLGGCMLGPSLVTALLCWPLLARGRQFAPYLVLLSWLSGSMIGALWIPGLWSKALARQDPAHTWALLSLPCTLSTLLVFLVLCRITRRHS